MGSVGQIEDKKQGLKWLL